MAGHDDELDRRIRDTLGMAQADAPAPVDSPAAVASRPGPTSPVGRRRSVYAGALAIAAALVAVVVLATRGDDDTIAVVVDPTDSSAEATTPPETVAPSSTVAPSTTVFDPAACGRALAYPYEEYGQMHTVVPSELPLVVTFDAVPLVCVGGSVPIVVTVRNTSDADVRLERTHLVVSSGADKWAVGSVGPALVPAAAAVDLPSILGVPTLEPGSYTLFLYGFGGYTNLAIVGPTACGAGQLATAIVQLDGAGMRQYTVTRVTNQDDVPCVLPRLSSVHGVTADGTVEYIQPLPGQGFFDPLTDPLRNFVLQPGEQADVYVTTASSCLDGTVQPRIYPRVRAQLGLDVSGEGTDLIDLGTDVDVACGLWVSDWSESTAR